ncbi:hypothetical protein [Listeria phage LP-KV022]|uniref:Uncharacterized protein n=7 Tax=Homburgvirus TaxID=1921125 RepID=A0A5A4K4N7_9CAUD|nr:hypothetical protein P70_0047 [Listeria phage P70]YP_008240466.1 hypothetical protein LP110_102 [Listeria phage LP-110]YP_009045079.1 hypothetical protein LP114_025 [Listeria phage LP-114]AWY07684.1 hypothetical protein [Listeria phage LP-KV022]QDK04549.1 hypothetical protein FK481_0035 [Listeria phage LP-010]QDK04657.1 hypothetical protein FK482_0035 [Listeria phage LP-013]QDK04768.1 hypothetical protein FK484_0035 [Listeria phage LP-031]AFQ96236.1 hypothetical protein P70_0047 [Listeria
MNSETEKKGYGHFSKKTRQEHYHSRLENFYWDTIDELIAHNENNPRLIFPVPDDEEVILQQAILRGKIVEGICEEFYQEFDAISIPNRLYLLLSGFILEVDNNGLRKIPKTNFLDKPYKTRGQILRTRVEERLNLN